jgi:hypothetical protein
LLPSRQTVLVRAYTDDNDDLVLSEIQPKFIVMFEPSMEFIRRIEVSGYDCAMSIHMLSRCPGVQGFE